MKTKKQYHVYAVSRRSGRVKSVVVSEADIMSALERLFQREGIQLTACDRAYLSGPVVELLTTFPYKHRKFGKLAKACLQRPEPLELAFETGRVSHKWKGVLEKALSNPLDGCKSGKCYVCQDCRQAALKGAFAQLDLELDTL